MKRLLLIGALFMCVFALGAQEAQKEVIGVQKYGGNVVPTIQLDAEPQTILPVKPYNTYTSVKGLQSLQKIQLGSSANVYGILLPYQQCLTYCPALEMLMFSHRQDHTNPGNSGYIQTTFSTDGGLNWDNNIVYDDDVLLGRYPSGVIYNPTGNTNPDNAFAVTAGPYTDGAGWKGNFFASMQIDGTNGDIVQINEDEAVVGYTNLVRNFMQIDDQGRVRIYGEKNTDDGTYYTGYETAIYTGVFDAASNAWTWTEDNIIPDYTTGTDGNPDGYRRPGMAWSKDGQIGYMIYIGRNANAFDPDGYHPMIYRTDDAGASWTLQPGFDWTNIPAIYDELIETNTPGVKRALFSLVEDAVVDADGHLHFATYINSASSTHPDSLGYRWVWAQIEGLMYHMWQTPTGWDADVIDIQWAKNVSDADSPIDVFWHNRLQMSKTPNEDLIVFTWTDTDEMYADLNLLPDIITQVYDINTGTRTVSQNITENTTMTATNHFLYVSHWAGYNPVADRVILHATTSEFGATDLDPVFHYYIKGAEVWANVEDVNPGKQLSFVSQNYPNPFDNTTRIDISLERDANVSVEIYNMLGQLVNSTAQNLTAGTHTLTMSAENLKTGVYFYTVKAGDNAVTKKMIVK